MPPKKNTTAASSSEASGADSSAIGGANFNGKVPSETDMKFFAAVMSNLTTKIDANWDEVAAAMSLKDGKCARERYRQIKNKFGWVEHETGSPGSSSGGGAGATTPGSGSGRRKTAKTATAAAANGPQSPTKVTKRRTPLPSGKKATASVAAAASDLNIVVKAEEQQDGEEGDQVMPDGGLADDGSV